MKRVSASILLALVAIVPSAGWAETPSAAASIYRTADVVSVKHGNTRTAVLDCYTEAYGELVVIWVRIDRCVVKSSGGGTVKALAGATFPGRFGATAGAGNLRAGTLDVCMSVTARYLGGREETVNDCNFTFYHFHPN